MPFHVNTPLVGERLEGQRASGASSALMPCSPGIINRPSIVLSAFASMNPLYDRSSMFSTKVPHRHSLAPFFAVVVGIGLFATMDALMKRASIASGVLSPLLARSGLGTLVLWPIWRLREGRGSWPGPEALRLHVMRGLVAAGMTAGYFWGLVRIPLAEAIAISFIAPLIALFLAAVLLGERVRPAAVGGSLVALFGVVLIAAGRLRAAAAGTDAAWGIASILFSAVLYAWNLVLQRQQAQVASPLEIAVMQNLVVALALLSAAAMLTIAGGAAQFLLVPAWTVWPDIAASALLASISLMMIAWAYARVEAQVLLPLEYTAFPWSALVGWVWFAEPVTLPTLGGLVLILLGVWFGARGAPQPQLPPG
jgi:S-adenosylmethionine uptake transporter